MRPIPSLLAAAVAGTVAMTSPVSWADDPGAPRDEILLTLHAEEYVETSTARVTAIVDMALTGETRAASGSEAIEILDAVVEGGDWRVVGFDRTRDPTGLERWRITAEARIPEAKLDGVYDRAREAGRPGRQIEIASVDFSPTLAEREATRASLRGEIYRLAAKEVEAVEDIWPDRGFRVQRIDFVSAPERPSPQLVTSRARTMEMAADDAAAPSDLGVAERMTVQATVVLAAPEPKRGRNDED